MPRSRSFHSIKSSFDPHQVHTIFHKERVITVAMSITKMLDIYLTDDFNFTLHPQAVSFLMLLYLNFRVLYRIPRIRGGHLTIIRNVGSKFRNMVEFSLAFKLR